MRSDVLTPVIPNPDLIDGRRADAELAGKTCSRASNSDIQLCANDGDLHGVKASGAMCITSQDFTVSQGCTLSLPSLTDLVFSVRSIIAKKEVVRPTTGRNIATMQDAESVRNRSLINNFPHYAMSEPIGITPTTCIPNFNASIPVLVDGRSPKPTSRANLNLGQDSYQGGNAIIIYAHSIAIIAESDLITESDGGQ